MIVYRGHRIAVAPNADGWSLRVLAPRRAPALFSLRNRVPHGRAVLLAEARAQIDRLVDGPPWQGIP